MSDIDGTARDAVGSARRSVGLARGLFVTVEGGEGSGKSTQLRRLADRLRALGRDVLTTREPGGTAGAERVRALLLDGTARRFGPHAETALFAAARADHVAHAIAPALTAGRDVLCDRFMDSSRAYQAGDPLLRHLERAAVNGTVPDLTLIYDIDPAIGTERVRARDGALDRFEASDAGELRRRREAFRAIAAAEPHRCVVIDASGEPDEVAARTWAVVRERVPALAAAA